MTNLSPLALRLSQAHTDGAWEGVARLVEGMVAEPTERLRSPGRQWRRVKRGTIYTEVVRAELQIATIDVVEGSSMVVYRGEDGKLWVREETEFEDGRFEEIAPTPESTEPRP